MSIVNAIQTALSRRDAHYDTAVFPPEVMAQVCAKPLNTTRQWNQRVGTDDADFRSAQRRGMPALYSYRSLATYGAATPLINSGVDVATAYRAAKEWTWHGCAEVRRPDASQAIIIKGREAIGLFANDQTLLVYRQGFAEVMPLSAVSTSYADKLFPPNNRLSAPTLIWLDFVLKHVEMACLEYLDKI